MKNLPVVLAILLAAALNSKASEGTSLENNGLWPKNLLRHHLGARAVAGDNILSDSLSPSEIRSGSTAKAAALVSDEPFLRSPLPVGRENRDYRLGIPQPVKRITFLNHGMVGKVTAFGRIGAGEDKWAKMDSAALVSGKRDVEMKFAPMDATFVRLQFDLVAEGQLSGLGLFGSAMARDYWTVLEPVKGSTARVFNPESLNFSLTNGTTGARVVWVSSTIRKNSAEGILDEDHLTRHEFSVSDAAPALLIDLGDSARIGRISAVHSGFTGTFEAATHLDEETVEEFLSTEIPDLDLLFRNDDPLMMDSAVNDSDMAFHQIGREGRYVLLRWQAEHSSGDPFFVREVAVFSMEPPRLPDGGNGKNPIGKNPYSSGKDGLAGSGPGHGAGSPGSNAPGVSGIPGLQTTGANGISPTVSSLSPGLPFGPPGGSFTGGGVETVIPGNSSGPIATDNGGPIIRPVSF